MSDRPAIVVGSTYACAGPGSSDRSSSYTVPADGCLSFEADAAGEVALGVQVDGEHAAVGEGERGGEIDRGRGLSDPTFLVCDGDDAAHLVLMT